MRIAFASHEFPPDTAGGGIGTYLAQVTAWLAAAGHSVEVFCGAAGATGFSLNEQGVGVHRVSAASPADFREAIVPVFTAAHQARPFEVLEGTDFDAPGNAIKRTHPTLPYVVKLHTPRFAVDELHARPLSLRQAWRMRLGALRRGRWPTPPEPIRNSPSARAELDALAAADEIAAPSRAIADAAQDWVTGLADKISIFPYPYVPPASLLALPPATDSRRVLFVGRLEERKGVVDLADAVPLVLKKFPDARFTLVGRSMRAPDERQGMMEFLRARLGPAIDAVEFTGPIPPAELPAHFARSALLVAPSHWESFGLVCCEGMAAGRPVIGSREGGMAEILAEDAGLLVSPRAPVELAEAISRLLGDPVHARQLAETGRRRVSQVYPWTQVGPAQLASYNRARSRCRPPAN